MREAQQGVAIVRDVIREVVEQAAELMYVRAMDRLYVVRAVQCGAVCVGSTCVPKHLCSSVMCWWRQRSRCPWHRILWRC